MTGERVAVIMVRRVGAGLVVALAAASAVVVFLHVHRFDGGPLADPSFGGVGVRAPVGEGLGFTMIWLDNHGGRTIRLERVTARSVRPGTLVRMWAVAPRHPTLVNGDPFPAGASFLRKVGGFSLPAHARGVQLIAQVTATRPGCFGFNGVDIAYRAGSRRYRRTARDLFLNGHTPRTRGCSVPS